MSKQDIAVLRLVTPVGLFQRQIPTRRYNDGDDGSESVSKR